MLDIDWWSFGLGFAAGVVSIVVVILVTIYSLGENSFAPNSSQMREPGDPITLPSPR